MVAVSGLGLAQVLGQTAPPVTPTPPTQAVIRPVLVNPIVQTNLPPPNVQVVRPLPGTPPTFVRPMPPPAPAVPSTPPNALAFDADSKEYVAKSSETTANFKFWLTNTASVVVQINNVHTSCGCTVAKLPQQPWAISPGGSGPIEVSVDLRGKRGILMKSVTVQSTSGVKNLLVKVTVEDDKGFTEVNTAMLDPDRVKNIQLSLVNRQVVFTDRKCAECHADKALGKMGKDLFDVACAICHDTPHRATMVADLKTKHPSTAEEWKQWIAFGKSNNVAPNSLMPAFAKSQGGILTDAQIQSLADYASTTFTNLPLPSPLLLVQPMPQPGARPVTQPVIIQAARPPASGMPQPVLWEPPILPPAVKVEPPATPISDFPFPKEK